MREKLQGFFNRFISNDNGDITQTQRKQRGKLIVILVIVFLVLFILLRFTVNDETTEKERAEKIAGNFKLVDKDEMAKTNWIGSASEDMDLAKKKIDTLTTKNEKLEKELSKMQSILKDLVNEKEKQREEQTKFKNLPPPTPTSSNKLPDLNKVELDDLGRRELYTNFPKPNEGNNFGISQLGAIPQMPEDISVRYTSLEDSLAYINVAPKPEIQKQEAEKKPLHIIPTGSITRAVLLSGFDAPTMTQAKTNPLPILMRVIDTSILPNTWQYDIKDCFITAEGYGDLTSERAYIRTNTLACITDEGKHIEVNFAGSVAGEDGKTGLKGAVVTKQGALLARTLIAGFLQGVGNSFGQTNATTIVSGSGVTSTPTNQTATEAMRSGIFKGLSASAEKLADFYLKMADQISPVIEISAGREITITTTSRVELKTLEES
ncbi:MAG: conjugal transfer protein TraB [Helicobacter apodemus]|nr:conjugal transfer protein TraB [Helicobacter apodemus]